MKRLNKYKLLKLLGYFWGNRLVRYITILALLLCGLYSFTDSFDRKNFKNLSEDQDSYFFYLPSQKKFSNLEYQIAKELAEINNLKFIEIEQIPKNQFAKILKEIEIEDHFNEGWLDYNLQSYFKNLASRVINSQNLLDLNDNDSRNTAYNKNKDFVKWLSKIKNAKTKFTKITPYDDIIKKYAKEYGIDWRLVASQMFFESKYKQYSRSFAGAMGLMQLSPVTAKEFGLKNAYHVEDNIALGVKYLKSRLDIFKRVDDENRFHFALASYNAGLGHVLDAQKLALENGLNPYKWENINQMLLDLTYYDEPSDETQDESQEETQYSYCRGFETVAYVNNTMSRYTAYKTLVFTD